jgi:hypothetical protein
LSKGSATSSISSPILRSFQFGTLLQEFDLSLVSFWTYKKRCIKITIYKCFKDATIFICSTTCSKLNNKEN